MPAPRLSMWLYFFQMPSHYKLSVCVFVTSDAESASSNFSSLFWACLFSGVCVTYWNIAKQLNLLFIFSKKTVWAYRGDVGFLWIISCSFLVFLLLLIFKWPSQNRELFGLCNNPCTGTRPFLYPARCAGWCNLNVDFKEQKNVNKYCTCVRGNNWTILDEASGNLEGSYLKACNVYKHKMLWFLLPSKETSVLSLCLLLTLGIQWRGRWEQA